MKQCTIYVKRWKGSALRKKSAIPSRLVLLQLGIIGLGGWSVSVVGFSVALAVKQTSLLLFLV